MEIKTVGKQQEVRNRKKQEIREIRKSEKENNQKKQ